jgi:thioredoxin 1
MRRPELAKLIAGNFVVVKIGVSRFDKNVALAAKYGVPIQRGIPALAVLNSRGKLLYSMSQGQFANARTMSYAAFLKFFRKWAPKR